VKQLFGTSAKSVYRIENFTRLTYRKQLEALHKLKDPVTFVKDLLGLKLFDYQKEILLSKDRKLHIRKGRQIGASFILAIKCVVHAVLHPHSTIAVISPSQRQSSLVFRYIRDVFQAHELLRPEIENRESRYSQTVIVLPNGSTIYSLPCGNDGRTIRGISIPTGSIMIVDEAAFIPEKVWEAIDYFTALGGQEIMSSTPLNKSGRFYESSLDMSYRHMHIPTWDNPLISKEWIEEKKSLRSYTNEIAGEFITGEGRFFDADLIRACIDADLDWNEPPVKSMGLFKSMGIDVSIERDPCVMTVVKLLNHVFIPIFIRAYKKKNNKTSYEVDYTPVKSYDEIVAEANSIHQRYGVHYAAVDATYNPYVAERLAKFMEVFPIKFNSSAKNGNPMKTDLMYTLLGGLSSERVKLPNHPTLIRQLYNYEYEITETKATKFSETDEDFIDSLALSLYTELAIKEADNFAVA